MRAASVLLCGFTLFVAGASAQTQHDHSAHLRSLKSVPVDQSPGSPISSIPDVKVKTQDGQTVDFYSDLIKEKVVAVNFVFTTCTTVCPPMGALFGKLQELNSGRMGKEVHLVSVSIDPLVDTPERLKAWGKKFGAGPGWTLVTGEKADIDRIMKAMNVYVPNFVDHQPVTLIGNDATGEWKRSYGFTSAAKLNAMLEEISGEGP